MKADNIIAIPIIKAQRELIIELIVEVIQKILFLVNKIQCPKIKRIVA